MNSDAVGYLIYGLIMASTIAVLVYRAGRRVRARMPASIVRQLRDTGQPVTIVLKRGSDAAWNPRRSPTFGPQMIYGRGTATYSLTSDGSVRLIMARESGESETYLGAVPAVFVDPVVQARHDAVKRAQRKLALAHLGVGLVGAAAGYFSVNGGFDMRATVALLGLFVGFAASSLLVPILVMPPLARRIERRLGETPTKDEGGSAASH